MESVKATQDLVAPISGTIEKVNEKLKSKPGLLNEDPYGEGWILVVTPTNIDAELRERHGFRSSCRVAQKAHERKLIESSV